MKRFGRFAAVLAAAVSVGAGTIAVAPAATASGFSYKHSCATPAAGHAACDSLLVTGAQPMSATQGHAGYHPADLLAAYNLDATHGAGQKIAIVDAFDDPSAEADLSVYRSAFGLSACTTANGCFKKVNQTGGSTPPTANANWAGEISLDVDMASAICPNCKILLVEATDNGYANLAASVNEAATLGATVISNSYGGGEFSTESSFASAYNHPGIPITVSSGDSAYPARAQFPAALTTVTAVGGTALKHTKTGRGWKETVWLTSTNEGAGSGCSQYIAKPSWQKDTGCAQRTVADVSAVADPATGVSVYDTYGEPGWLVFGGTSVAAPVIAGVYALAGNGATINNASLAYSHTANLYDVKKGNNGTCSGSYLCTAKKGYDGPTGLGTPNGTAAF